MKSKKMRERRSVRAAVHRVDVVVDTDEGQRDVKKLRSFSYHRVLEHNKV
jgi:hypothetical protein